MKNIKEFKPLIKLIKEDKVKLIIATICLFIGSLTSIATGYLNGRAVESITNNNIKMALLYLFIYFIISIIFGGIVEIIADFMLQKIESKVSRKLGYFTYLKTLNLPAWAFEEKNSGELINRITNDTDTLNYVFGRLINIVSSVITSIVIFVYVISSSLIVGLEILLFLVILFFVIKKYNPKLKQAHEEIKKDQDKLISLVNESVRGVREIKTLGIKNNLLTDCKEYIKNIFNSNQKELDITKRFRVITTSLKIFLEVGVFSTCAILLYYDKTTITFFIAMTYYVYRYMWLIENLNSFTENYQKLSVSLGRINEILENRLYKDVSYGTVNLKDVKGVIEFKNVSFNYPNEENTLNDFNLKIEPNKKIAIVGKSGQGKSTLFNLMTRIFDVNKGSILIDGIDIKNLDEESLSKNISIIRQDPFIFNRTIKENFKLINQNITLDEIRKYTKMAYLDDYIMKLPNKYDNVIGEGGVNLSGGQKQRLSIARTLAKQSKIILFDEATSALDNNSQEYIKKTIDNLVKDHTIVIVAHRLSTIMDADVIHVVDNGKIIDSGSHEELMKKSKIYKNLYESESLNL